MFSLRPAPTPAVCFVFVAVVKTPLPFVMTTETMSADEGYGFSRTLWMNVAATTLGLTYSAYRHLRNYQELPPGPWGVPLLGYTPFLTTHCTYLKYNELARRYGPICSLTQRGNTLILLSDHKLIKTAFDMKQITGRPNDGYMDIIGGYGEFSRDKPHHRQAPHRYIFSFSYVRCYQYFFDTFCERFLRGRRNNILYKFTRT